MSRFGEHDGSRAGEFVESLALERDLPNTGAIAAVGVSASTLINSQPPTLIEANNPNEAGHFDDAAQLYHQHRTTVTLPLLQGLIYGGSGGFGNNETIVTLPAVAGATGFYRAYFRMRGICPMVPFDTVNGVPHTESLWHENPYGWEVLLDLRNGGEILGADVSNFISHPHPHAEAFGAPVFTVPRSLILNRTSESSGIAPRGAFSMDRILGFSVRGSLGLPALKLRYSGEWYKFHDSAWYAGGPPDYFTFFPFPFGAPQQRALFGPDLPGAALGTTDLMWKNDAGINPPSLLAPHAPMIGANIGDPVLSNYVEVQFLGYRPEADARAEEIIDVTPPVLVSDLA